MDCNKNYVGQSLGLHLFFARIMKEHALFMEAAYTPVNASMAQEADHYKQEFEHLLLQVIALSNGIVDRKILASGEILTEFTAGAERQTARLTGIPIKQRITALQARLCCARNSCITEEQTCQVRALNQTALRLLDGLIRLKEKTLNGVLSCQMFTMNYPLLIEHILREARLYQTFVCALESGKDLDCGLMRETEVFWNQIMMEHALFIRGLLDPSENELIQTSDGFAKDYATLLARAREVNDQTLVRREALQETIKFRDFKATGAQGIQNCRIRSVILPLLADHVLREANHYIRLLRE